MISNLILVIFSCRKLTVSKIWLSTAELSDTSTTSISSNEGISDTTGVLGVWILLNHLFVPVWNASYPDSRELSIRMPVISSVGTGTRGSGRLSAKCIWLSSMRYAILSSEMLSSTPVFFPDCKKITTSFWIWVNWVEIAKFEPVDELSAVLTVVLLAGCFYFH